MAPNKCQLLAEHEKRNLIDTSHIIDLTDKPIGLARDEIGWSKVRATASNCICCCYNNSITLVTTDNSYALDHVPLDNIQAAQVNPTLQFLALSNHRKLVVTELVDLTERGPTAARPRHNYPVETKVVNLAGQGLSMSDILFWKWVDHSTLAVLSLEALYICSIQQPTRINHPTHSALNNRTQHLPMEKVFETHPHLSSFCQVHDIQMDPTGNLYAISSLYSTNSLLKTTPSITHPNAAHQKTAATATNSNHHHHQNGSGNAQQLKHSFSSVPAHLSQLQYMEQQSFDSVKMDHILEPQPTLHISDDVVCGLVQIYSRVSDRSQLIQAHAVTYTSSSTSPNLSTDSPVSSLSDGDTLSPSILIAATKLSSQMRVSFIEMETIKDQVSTGQNASANTSFDRLASIDFPTSIVCSRIESEHGTQLHVALITTKHGQLFVCSVAHSTILFNTQIATDIISSTVLDVNTQGIMIICRNGQVLLIKLNLSKLIELLDESKTLRYIASSHNISSISTESVCDDDSSLDDSRSIKYKRQAEKLYSPLQNGLEVLMSTKL